MPKLFADCVFQML